MTDEQSWLDRKRFLRLSVVSLLLFLLSCGNEKKKNYPGPPGYDLNHPMVYKLPSLLDEISGLIFYQKDTCLFAIDDENGILFKIFLTTPVRIEQWNFSDGADYEDLSLVDSSFFVLKSKGKLERFSFGGRTITGFKKLDLPVTGANEFETMFFDQKKNKLFIICKECASDKKEKITGFSLDPYAEKIDTSFSINAGPILQKLKLDQKIKPSAASVNPVTGEIFMISSVSKVLIIFNPDFSLKQAYPISSKIFKQPEGLTFTQKGDLLISNESAESGSAEILLFKYKSQHQ